MRLNLWFYVKLVEVGEAGGGAVGDKNLRTLPGTKTKPFKNEKV